jgi:hypothetical protein
MSAGESQRRGRLRLRHLLEVTEAKAEEMAELRPRFERLANDTAKPRVVSAFNLFQTPEGLADRVAAMVGPFVGRLLEPSAGLGRLYRAVRCRSSCEVVLVEQAADCCAELYREIASDDAAKLVQADFLTCEVERLGGLFDRILMNPPFKMGTDVRHINHARGLLAPGGKLVAICANGPKQRAKLMPEAAQWVELPAGSFASEGTKVDAAIVTFTT